MYCKVQSHPDAAVLEKLFPAVRDFQKLASKHGISDIFQDNGGKLLQTLLILNLKGMDSREGNDARDADGHEFELKTANICKVSCFTTHHHLNLFILDKYRKVAAWYFSLYQNIELVEIYRMTPDQLEEHFFTPWEKKWKAEQKDINNPKIPVKFVKRYGELIYRTASDETCDLLASVKAMEHGE